MDTRGVVIAGICPRCEETTAPTADRMVTCAKCSLRFDTHAKGGTTRPKKRFIRPTAPRSKLVIVKRTRAALELRFRRNALDWFVLLLLLSLGVGVVVVGAKMPVDVYPLAIMFYVFGALVIPPILILARPVVLRVDADWVRADAPFHHPRVPRSELDDVVAEVWPATARRVEQYAIVALGKTGSKLLMTSAYPDVAAHVIDEIDRAVAEIPATGSSSR
jgi:hypothetical protein